MSLDLDKPNRWYVDTHAHLHARFDVERFFDAAAEHFAAAGATTLPGGRGVLCLTEVAGAGGFERLRDEERAGRWRFEAKGERVLSAVSDDGGEVVVVAGRQVRCDNGLEVLGIGRGLTEVEDGMDLAASLEAVREGRALVVVPYGVGKWTGRRGGRVRRLIEEGPADVAFGDNGGRPGWSSGSDTALLRLARERGRTVLVGTDPLPLAAGETRAGSWGVVVEVPGGTDDGDAWVDALVGALRDVGPSGETFGGRVGLFAAVAQQIGARL
ncbi:MAG: hypothetical protein AAFX76_04375 [Planctomycetota bacterium]